MIVPPISSRRSLSESSWRRNGGTICFASIRRCFRSRRIASSRNEDVCDENDRSHLHTTSLVDERRSETDATTTTRSSDSMDWKGTERNMFSRESQKEIDVYHSSQCLPVDHSWWHVGYQENRDPSMQHRWHTEHPFLLWRISPRHRNVRLDLKKWMEKMTSLLSQCHSSYLFHHE